MATRSNIYARGGVAAASQPLAVSTALQLLHEGGSAIDAAIGASAVLAVVEPGASHLGGDAFVLHYEKKSGETIAFNGSGEAPHDASRQHFQGSIPLHGFQAATIPGLVSTWFAAHQRFGKLPFTRILADAIGYASLGFPVNHGFIRRIAMHLEAHPHTPLFEQLGIPTSLKLGQLIKQPDLAWSLNEIALHGRDAFYNGEIAARIIKATGGWFDSDDLASHHTRVEAPLKVRYREKIVYGQPPPSQGMILMSELRLVEKEDLSKMSEVERIHLMVEAKKIGFADRYRVLGDDGEVRTRVEAILSDDHIERRFSEIDPKRAAVREFGTPSEGSDTTYFLTADSDGNAVSWIQSVFHGFGASFAVEGTGIILNNRLTGFSLDEKSINCIKPGKRPAHTLNAFLLTNSDGRLSLVGGTPGANIQVQTNLQVISRVVDLKMSAQDAIDAPRWQHLAQSGASSLDEVYDGTLQMESRFTDETFAGLRERGHKVEALPPFGHGSSVQLLKVLDNGTYEAGSDPRAEGLAAGI